MIIVQAAAAAIAIAAAPAAAAAAMRGWRMWRQLERARAEQTAVAAQTTRRAGPGWSVDE